MNLVKITDAIIIDPDEVVSIQEEKLYKYSSASPSDCMKILDFEGSVMIMSNGRKIYVKDMNPEQIFKIIDPKTSSEFENLTGY